jgi:hypothetical protein
MSPTNLIQVYTELRQAKDIGLHKAKLRILDVTNKGIIET